jgi:hypothetical protein
MNNEELAQAIIDGTYTERSADAFVRDNERLQDARSAYEAMIADLEWSYYRQSVDNRASTLEVFIQLGMHNTIYTRLRQAVTDTYRAQRVLDSKKHNIYPWSLVCEECLHVLTGTHDTWEEADVQRTQMQYQPHEYVSEASEKCIATLTIMPAHVAQSYTSI